MSDARISREKLVYIEARHQDIIKLERNIRELNEMFLDLSILISDQGEQIDSIEKNLSNVDEYARAGEDQLKQAIINQRKARKVVYIFTKKSII